MKESTKENIVGSIIVGVIVFCALHFFGPSLNKGAEKEYYNKTEALLDSINTWHESFMDTVMETDVYYEYEVARENLK